MRFTSEGGRLGERRIVHGIVVDWNTDGRRTRRLRRHSKDVADVIDISVSGAQFLAKKSKKIGIGTVVTIAAGGSLGTVRIRRIADLANGDLCSYGVEFVEIEEPLEALLFQFAKAQVPDSVQVVWRTDAVPTS